MPLLYLRRLTSPSRTESANRHIARYLAFIAGATNVGGLLAVHQYTSHVSGIVSAAANNLAAGNLRPLVNGLLAVFAFFLGACASTLLIRWGRERELHSRYALPLLSEAALLLTFGMIGQRFSSHPLGMVLLLCFSMGLQNAMITKISDSVIRTTHMTGLVTDIGIALGRILYPSPGGARNGTEFKVLRLLVSLVALFFLGGVAGAQGFSHFGFFFVLPLAGILILLAVIPLIDDFRGSPMSEPAVSEFCEP